MTGFGRAAEKTPYGTITVEIKALNHKSLNITCSLLDGFFLLEEKLKGIFEGKVFRGKIFVKVTREGEGGQKTLHAIKVNESVANEYLKKIKKVQKNLSVGGELQIRDLIGFPGVVEYEAGKKARQLWPYIRKTAEKALKNLVEYRKNEGTRLSKDFIVRLGKTYKNLREIKKHEKQSISNYKAKLARAIRELPKNAKPDKGRVEEEVALFARNCDITEEIIRLQNHIATYKKTLKTTKADVGKKLDFIAQEMHREANTIGSKAADVRISRAVIEIKSEIEKMREQVKNIE
jgi:uncharacterized protein (TIGR00255 family)